MQPKVRTVLCRIHDAGDSALLPIPSGSSELEPTPTPRAAALVQPEGGGRAEVSRPRPVARVGLRSVADALCSDPRSRRARRWLVRLCPCEHHAVAPLGLATAQEPVAHVGGDQSGIAIEGIPEASPP